MANSFKSLFSKIINKDEGQVSQPNAAQHKETKLDSSDISDDLNIDEFDNNFDKQNNQHDKVETDNGEMSKQACENVCDKENNINIESNNSSKKTKFLIVDDANFMRILLRKILEEEGFDVIGEASNGEEAIAKINTLSPDIVTMDITMPEMDGITALKEIMKTKPAVKVIMCSAINQREMVLEALKIGAKDFISKPFEQNKVADVIRRVAEMN